MFQLNKTSQLVTIDPAMSVDAYEDRLGNEGLTGGYFPITGSETTLTTALASRIPNLYFSKYGGIEELCVGGKVATPSGLVFPLKIYPRAAIGSDLRRVILGSQNILGRFEEVTLRIFPIPEYQLWGLALCENESEAVSAMRDLVGLMVHPLFMRVIDEEEGGALLQSLGLPAAQKFILAFKLTGLRDYVDATLDTISKINAGKKVFFYWPSKESEISFLDEQLLSAASYQFMNERYASLLGLGTARLPDQAERNFEKFFTCPRT